MSGRKVMATFYGKYAKYEVIKPESSDWSNPGFYIFRDGEQISGGYDSLEAAVEEAKKLSGN